MTEPMTPTQADREADFWMYEDGDGRTIHEERLKSLANISGVSETPLYRHRPAWNFDMSAAPRGVELLCAVEPDRTADELHRAIFGQEATSPNFVVIARRKVGDPKRKVRERYNGRLWNAVAWMNLPELPESCA